MLERKRTFLNIFSLPAKLLKKGQDFFSLQKKKIKEMRRSDAFLKSSSQIVKRQHEKYKQTLK